MELNRICPNSYLKLENHSSDYSLALDESTDIEDTAQLLVFIREIDENFEITEELLSLEHLKDTTTGQDLFESVENCLDRSGLPLHKLANITTDGASALTGKNVGLIELLKRGDDTEKT